MGYPNQEFDIRSQIKALITTEINKSTSYGNSLLVARVGEDRLIEALKVRYDASREYVKTLLFNTVAEVIVDIIKQRKKGFAGNEEYRPRYPSWEVYCHIWAMSGRMLVTDHHNNEACKAPYAKIE